MISPEIWQDPNFLKLKSTLVKLTFIGAFSLADDEAIITADQETLRLTIHGNQVKTTHFIEALKVLESRKMIVKYSGNNSQEYYFLPNFFKHQRLDHPSPTKNDRPPKKLVEKHPKYFEGISDYFKKDSRTFKYYFGNSENPHESSRGFSRSLVKSSLVKDSKDIDVSSEVAYLQSHEKFRSIRKPEKLLIALKDVRPDVNILAELKEMNTWLVANPGKVYKNYSRFIRNWIIRTDRDKYYQPEEKSPEEKKTFLQKELEKEKTHES